MKDYEIIEIDEIQKAISILNYWVEIVEEEYDVNLDEIRAEKIQVGQLEEIFYYSDISGNFSIDKDYKSFQIDPNREEAFNLFKAINYIDIVCGDFFKKIGRYDSGITIQQLLNFYIKIELKKDLEKTLTSKQENKKQFSKI